MTRAKDISKILTDGNISGTLDVSGAFTSLGIDDNADATAITIDSSERVGIGASPTQKLEVAGNIFIYTSGNPNLTVKTSGSGNNPYVRMQADSNYWDLQTLFSNTNNELNFGYNGSSKMLITSSGNVGIGTSVPQGKLSVSNGTIFVGSEANTTQTNNLLNGYGYRIGSTIYGSVSVRSSYNNGNNQASLEFYTAGSDGSNERMRISSSGNVGIGTSVPDAIFTVDSNVGGSSTATIARFHSSKGESDSTYLQIAATRHGTASVQRVQLQAFDDDGSTGRTLALNPSGGNVGIGTNSPTFAAGGGLHVKGSDFTSIRVSGGSSTGIDFAQASDGTAYAYNRDNDSLVFGTNNTERMRLTSTGAMTMGTTSPLSVDGGITLKHTDAGAYPTLLFLQNQPGSGGTMGADIHMGYASDYGTILRFFGNPFSSRPGGLQVRRVTGSGSSDLSMELNGTGDLFVPRVYVNTTGGSANVLVASNGQFLRSTSSQRYKNTISDATHGLTELLTLRPVTYKGNNDGDTIFGGLIAEEVHDAGLTEFVQYDDDNKPDALAYGNMVSLCIKAIQELKAENTALANRITTLEGN